MRHGFFSDVHSNLEALKAVIEDFEKERLQKIFFLGDAVGYGPDPNECVVLVQKIATKPLMGNHDYAALDMMETSWFNQYAKEAIEWTKDRLDERNFQILSDYVMDNRFDIFHMVHSTPKDPTSWDYIFDLDEAEENFGFFRTQVCLVGHSHRPFIIKKYDGKQCFLHDDTSVKIEEGFKYLVNIGAVGQPRDGDNRACYLIYDDEERIAQLKRVSYDIKKTQKKMRKAKLPQFLIERLYYGR
jgi:diadenosine tetraphosphatase ApaH/serine/threonine PP2A family protein phosphatase